VWSFSFSFSFSSFSFVVLDDSSGLVRRSAVGAPRATPEEPTRGS